jgi:hypothetical protein
MWLLLLLAVWLQLLLLLQCPYCFFRCCSCPQVVLVCLPCEHCNRISLLSLAGRAASHTHL